MTDRPFLVLNCAEDRVQFVLAQGKNLILHQEWAAPARVMRYLAPALDSALRALELRMEDLGGIACVRGPGNFTGLRLCLATACGLAMGAGLPMAGLDYLPLLAQEPGSILQGQMAVLTHARTNLVHAQLFRVPTMDCLMPAQVMAVDDPAALCLLQDPAAGPLFLFGSGVRRNLTLLQTHLPQARILDESWDHPRPEALIRAALATRFGPEPIVPLYLRPCDAEENLERFAAKRGISVREAQERLRAGMESQT